MSVRGWLRLVPVGRVDAEVVGTARAVAHHLVIASLLVFATGLAAVGIAGAVAAWSGWGAFVESFVLPELMIGVSWTGVGLALAGRRPRNLVGWLVLVAGIAALGDRAATAVGNDIDIGELTNPPAVAVTLVAAVHLLPLPPFPVLPAVALVVFPEGRPPNRHWWWVLAPLLVVSTGASVGVRWAPDPEPFAGAVWDTTAGFGGLLLVAAVIALVRRRRGADAVLRQQVRGILVTMGFAVAVVIVFVLLERPWLGNSALALIPVSIGAAVVRYRLFDLDRLISRTVAYSLVVALLAGTYLGMVIALGAVARALTGESGDLVVALSTLTVVVLFQPVRQRVQRVVDRRFDRARYDAVRTVEAFGRELRDEVSLDAIVEGLRTTATGALHPTSVGVTLVQERGS